MFPSIPSVLLIALLIAVLPSGAWDAAAAVPETSTRIETPSAVDIQVPPVTSSAPASVTLPAPAATSEHPRLLLTRKELIALRQTLQDSPRGPATLKTLLDVANGRVQAPLDFPDPHGTPAQLTDRSDAIAKAHDRLSVGCGTCGIAYALTGDLRYAGCAAEILRGYAARYVLYPEHRGVNHDDTGKVMAQKLSEAMWLIPLLEGYDYIYDSGVLSDHDHSAIENGLFRPAITFIRRADPAQEVANRTKRDPNWRTAPVSRGNGAHVGNWLNFYNAATMLAGSAMNDRNMIDLAAADYRMLITRGVTDDGLWNEGAIGYQFFALQAMVVGMEAAARQGIDLWSYDHSRVKMLFDSPLRYAYPDGTAPGIGDSDRVRFGDWTTMIYDYAYLRYGDPRYERLVNLSPRQLQMSEGVYYPTRIYTPMPAPPRADYPSTVFQQLGFAILRDNKSYSLLDYGPFAGTHGHYDKLNLILFLQSGGAGDEIGGEPRFHRYEDPLHDEWTVQTVAHNTMAVDEHSQSPASGKLLVFRPEPRAQLMRAETAAAYPGSLLDRTVVVTPDLILDLYHGESGQTHTWDRTFRYQGSLRGFPQKSADKPLGAQDGYQHLLVRAETPAEGGWRGGWDTTIGRFDVDLAGAPGQKVFQVAGPDREEIALARQTGKAADFVAAYRMESWKNPVVSLRILPSDTPGVTVAEVRQQDGARTLVVVAHAAGTWKAAGWDSDARILYLRTIGKRQNLLRSGGTFARRTTATNSGSAGVP